MMKRILARLSPATHLIMRIWMNTILIVVVMVLTVGMLIPIVMRDGLFDQALEQVQASTTITAAAISDNYSGIMLRFVESCGTEEFQRVLHRVVSAGAEEQEAVNLALQPTLNALIEQNPMIRSAVFVNRAGMVFHPLAQDELPGAVTWAMGVDENTIRGATLLPRIQGPMAGLDDVMPLAIPLRVLEGTGMTTVARSMDETVAMLYLFMDATVVDTLFRSYETRAESGQVYLMNSAGMVLDCLDTDEVQDYVCRYGVSETVERARSAGESSGQMLLDGSYVVWHAVGSTSLSVVQLVSPDMLSGALDRFTERLPTILVSYLLVMTLVTLISARTIVIPLRKLMNAVDAIAKGRYTSGMVLNQQDELGQLSAAIDGMYVTIEQQMDELRQERTARDNAEIRLIAEQINPHFLYNTLEAINMEVYGNHPENASMMIQNLGEFMRIGLSFGSKTITVRRELEHVQAYVNIMNNRFNQRIVFTGDVDESCLEKQVLKIILQPLVENSIRHGFRLDSSNLSVGDHFISVEVRAAQGGGMTMAVIDNGVGIDLAMAEQALRTPGAQQRHVGLGNVYQRLKMHYGPRAEITFESIPYFRNVVCIHLPPDEEKA